VEIRTIDVVLKTGSDHKIKEVALLFIRKDQVTERVMSPVLKFQLQQGRTEAKRPRPTEQCRLHDLYGFS